MTEDGNTYYTITETLIDAATRTTEAVDSGFCYFEELFL